jgi:Predicted membrane protein
MIIVVIRTLILYTLVIVALRLMGKREIGQLQPFELVVILMISDLAAVPSENVGIPLLSGIIPILVLLSASLTLAWISLKSQKARDIICGKPSILIERGKIIEEEMKNNCYNLTDLLEELRLKNIPNIADVEFAILENNGQLSVIPKALKRPTTPEDFYMTPKYEGLPHTLIMDGKLNRKALENSNKTLDWLNNELEKQDTKIEDVFFASLDSSDKLYVQTKQSKRP